MSNWMPEEPPDLYGDVDLSEPPEWVYDSSMPEEPPDDVLARLNHYAPPPIPSAEDYPVPEAVYADDPPEYVEAAIPVQEINRPLEERPQRDTEWQLQTSGVMIEAIQPDPNADPSGYAVGVVEVWHDPHTGDQTGAYLHMADAPHLERAEQMRDNIYRLADEKAISDHEFGDFAHGLIKGRGEWQPLTNAQWEFGGDPPTPDTPNLDDDAIWAERDRMLAQTFELAEPEPSITPDFGQVVKELGIQIEGFDPEKTPPPLFDELSNTGYWIGVYQDPANPDEAVTSILSINADQAKLAPVATGDFDHAHQTAEYLLKVAERTQDVGQVLDAAEGMAVATQHRELWGMDVDARINFHPVMEINR